MLNCDERKYTDKVKNEDIAKILQIGPRTIDRVKKKIVEEGFEAAPTNRPTTRVYGKKADGEVEVHLIALSCSKPSTGFSR